MNIRTDKMATNVSAERQASAFAGRLRTVSLLTVLVGAIGSAGLFLRAGQRTPRPLLAIMAIWVFSPLIALIWANVVSKRWQVTTRLALYCVTLVVAVGTLAIYADDALGHRRPQAAFVYVIVPPVSWLLIALVVPIAALISRRSRRSDGA